MKSNNQLLRTLTALVVVLLCAAKVSAQEAYACYTPGNKTLTFYFDNKRSSRTAGETYDCAYTGNPDWIFKAAEFEHVVFNSSFVGASLTNGSRWFYGMTKLTNITCLEYFNTSAMTDMSEMFRGSSSLTSLDLSNFNTSKVTDMSNMFDNSSGLTTLDLNTFDTRKVNDMYRMFADCTNLRTIYVGDNWSTAASSSRMFENCINLEGCNGTVYDSNHVNGEYARLDNPPSSPGYFSPSISAYAVYTSNNNTLTFYYDYDMINHSGTVYRLGTQSTTPAWYENRSNINHVVFNSSFNSVRPTQMSYWFYGMFRLQDITGFQYLHTDDVTNMKYLFSGCSSLTSLDLTGFNTRNVENMEKMFQGCLNLEAIFIDDDWTTDAVKYSVDMFTGCTSLVGYNGTAYDENHTNKEYARYDNPPSSPGYLSPYTLRYGLRIAGIPVTARNASNIKGDAVTSGKVSFDPKTHTLTLTDATISNSNAPGIAVSTDYAFSDLTVKLVGNNTIDSGSQISLVMRCNTTFTGTGTLSTKFLYVYEGKCLTIGDGCTMTIGNIVGASNKETLVVKGASTQVQVTNNIRHFASVTLQDGLLYTKPVGGYYDTQKQYVVDANGNEVSGVTISNLADYGLKVSGVSVTNQNASAITGTGISGAVKFDVATRTLTLTNATITSSESVGISTDSYVFNNLTIKLVGNNEVNTTSSYVPIVLSHNTTITGTGTITTNCIRVANGKELTIGGGCTVNANRVEGVKKTETLVLRNAQTRLEVTGSSYGNIYDFASVTMYDGLHISMPVGGSYNTTNQYVVNASGSKATGVVISGDTDYNYGLNVAGTAVKAENCSDVLGDGTVSYDPDTRTLTLTDATLENSTASGIQVTTTYAYDDLTIRLVGDNVISKTGIYMPMPLRCHTTITGTGTLTIANNGDIDLRAAKNLVIEGGCTINAHAIGGYSGNGTLTVRGAGTQINLTYSIFDFASVTLEDGLNYLKPFGGSYDTDIHYVVDGDGNKVTNGVMVGAYLPGDVNADGTVGIGDIVAVTNVMAGIETNPDVVSRADVNQDGQVGIGDIVAITNIMAGIE
jgi:surface protein